jgi:predicted metal-dependent hydrolase
MNILPIVLPDGKTLPINIKKSNRAKKPRIIVDIVGIHAIIPSAYNIEDLIGLVEEKKNWIANASKYYEKLRSNYDEEHLRENTICFLGERYWIRIIKDRMSFVVVSESLSTITFHVTDRRKYKHDVFKWYKCETAKIISTRLPLIASKLNIQYNTFSIKRQKSRWGSCSRKRNLNFNALLSAAPTEVIDYVIIHELMAQQLWFIDKYCPYTIYRKIDLGRLTLIKLRRNFSIFLQPDREFPGSLLNLVI